MRHEVHIVPGPVGVTNYEFHVNDEEILTVSITDVENEIGVWKGRGFHKVGRAHEDPEGSELLLAGWAKK